jgi:hypothetical protein
VTYPGETKALVAQADTEVTEQCKKSASSASSTWIASSSKWRNSESRYSAPWTGWRRTQTDDGRL